MKTPLSHPLMISCRLGKPRSERVGRGTGRCSPAARNQILSRAFGQVAIAIMGALETHLKLVAGLKKTPGHPISRFIPDFPLNKSTSPTLLCAANEGD